MRKMSSLVLVLFVVINMMVPVLAPASGQSLFPVMALAPLNPQISEVTVTPSSIGRANLTGEVTVEKMPWGTVDVALDGNASTGWPVTVYPDSFTFTTSDTAQYAVEVVVPQASSAEEVATVTVTGVLTWRGGTSGASASASVGVAQYFRFQLGFSKQLVGGNPAKAELTIWNQGNGIDKYKIGLEDEKKVKDKGLKVEFDKVQTVDIPPDGKDNITITVTYDGAKVKDDLINIPFLVTSLLANESDKEVEKTIILAVNIEKEGLGAVTDVVAEFLDAYGKLLIVLIVVLTVVALTVRWRKRRKLKGMLEEEEEDVAGDGAVGPGTPIQEGGA
jgi:hypothetical protein